MDRRGGLGAALLALGGAACLMTPGLRFGGALLLSAAAFVLLLGWLGRLSRRRRWARWARRALLGLFGVGLALFAALEAAVIHGARTEDVPPGVSCVLILGAGVNGTEPSLILETRLEAALSFLEERPEAMVIVSGGQGAGEDISEAACMARWLTARGVAEERILPEDRSTNTRENFAYSTALMESAGLASPAGFAFVTSDFHVARAKVLAGGAGVYGIAASLPPGPYYMALRVNYFTREAFALAKEGIVAVLQVL